MATFMELLAPAGGMAELKAAVHSGADAVYLGADAFSARAGAGNFNEEQLKEAVEYAHFYGVKVHCAINTLIKEKELQKATDTAIMASQCGVDALIIQDLGLATHLRKVLPDMELHASTQMTVTSIEGVKFLEQLGFSRIVLARELSLQEIEKIVKASKAEIEVFVHGALCMSYSGQCLMSSILGGRSGNRGRCAQPCRLFYGLAKDGNIEDEAYILSPKDMALVEHLSKLRKIGVASLKIEGRLKSAEYVSAVTGIYRKYIDNNQKISNEDMTELKNAFSRSGFTDGYFTEKLGRDMMSHKNPANNSGSTFSKEATERASGKVVKKAQISIYASLKRGEVLNVTAYDEDGNCVTVEGEVPSENAVSVALDEGRLSQQLTKLGATSFEAIEIKTEIDEGITVPIKEINQVRRNMCDALQKLRTHKNTGRVIDIPIEKNTVKKSVQPYLTASARTLQQCLEIIKIGEIKRVYVSSDIAEKIKGIETDCEIVTRLSGIHTKEKIPTQKAMASSPGGYYGYVDKVRYGDFRLNVYNSITANAIKGLESVTISPELNFHEIAEITANTQDIETEIIAYGRIPLMIMKNCPLKAMGKCQNSKDMYSLRDRKNMEFPIICAEGCRAILLNSLPIYTADIMEEVLKTNIDSLRLEFTIEDPDECRRIIDLYLRGLNGEDVLPMDENTFTRGHFRRGVL